MLYLESSLKEEPNLTFASILSTPEEAVNLKSVAHVTWPYIYTCIERDTLFKNKKINK